MKLDEYDRAILRELQVDGRMPVANLAKVVGLSETGARNRLQKMLQSDAIQIVAVGQPRLLGFDVEAILGVVLKGDPRIAAKAFGEIPEVMNVMISAGRFMSAKFGISVFTLRMAALTLPLCLKRFTRNLPTPATL